MDDEGRTRLERISDESQKLKKGNTARLAALLSQFDDVLFEQVQNSRIRALIENLRAHLTRIGHLTEGIPGRIEASVDQHERIVEAIAAHDPLAAEKHLRDHIRSVRDDQLQALGEAADQE
jgi:DNA-binding GntR family transcriptional regulator